MGKTLGFGLSARKTPVEHVPYVDDAGLESAGLQDEMRNASHGEHGPQTPILSRRELDRAKEEELLRIGLIGPTM